MNILPFLILIGLITGIIDFRFLLIMLVVYVVYKRFIEGKRSGSFFDDIKLQVSSIIKFFTDKNAVEDAQFRPKNSFFSSSNTSSMNVFSAKRLAIIGIVVVVFMLIIDGFVMVPAGHTAVLLDRGVGILKKPLPTGLHLKIPFWQQATILDTRMQVYTMSHAPAEGNKVGEDTIDALTKDGQEIKLDVSIQYYLPQENAPVVLSTVGLDYEAKVVRPATRSIIRNVITGFNSTELFQIEPRKKAEEMMNKGMQENLKKNHLVLDSVLLRNIQFSEVYLKAIEDKQIAEQKIQKAEFEKKESLVRKEKTIIEAQAEGESIRIKGEALQRSPQIIQLEMVQKLAPNIQWGVLPSGSIPLIDMKQLTPPAK